MVERVYWSIIAIFFLVVKATELKSKDGNGKYVLA